MHDATLVGNRDEDSCETGKLVNDLQVWDILTVTISYCNHETEANNRSPLQRRITMAKVLVSDPIDQVGIDILSQVAQVDVKTGLPPEELVKIIPEYDALMLRSGTRVTKEIIAAGTQLKIIGRAGVGVDNIDVPAATRQGIVVVNSPEGNTIAAAEHALAMMLSLSRHIPDANQSVKNKKWDRKRFVGAEVYKKTLGVVGLGKIGSHVANVAKSMGMKLLAYDPFISKERAEQLGCTLVDLDLLFCRI